jgi:endonuclease/exonuclease/phosphatase family metal-dependent hydrolase
MKILTLVLSLIVLNVNAKNLKVMSYNAYNLFDTVHEEGKNDWQYLPKGTPGKVEACNAMGYYKQSCLDSDWTSEKLNKKLDLLSQVIKSNGRPDILGIVEVENLAVTTLLAQKLGFKKVEITNSPDNRGIDVALLFNETELVKHIDTFEHKVTGHMHLDKKPTRNILEVILKVNGEYLSVFVNHWPSQSNPSIVRVLAAKTLKKVIRKRTRKNKNHKFIVLGDFNVLEKDYPHAFKSTLLNFKDTRDKISKKSFRDFFKKRELLDAHNVFMSDKSISSKIKMGFPKGTYFYSRDMTWNRLDRIFFSNNLKINPRLKVLTNTYRIHTPSIALSSFENTAKDDYGYGTKINGVPNKALYSDHFAVTLELEVK